MDKTVKYQIPYPTPDDLIRDTPKSLRSLAEQITRLTPARRVRTAKQQSDSSSRSPQRSTRASYT